MVEEEESKKVECRGSPSAVPEGRKESGTLTAPIRMYVVTTYELALACCTVGLGQGLYSEHTNAVTYSLTQR